MVRITHVTLLLSLATAALLPNVACVTLGETLIGGDGGTGGSGATGGAGGAGGTANQTGVPCDVAAVLATNCLSCHGPTPTGGAPMSLVTYEELTAPSKVDASKKFIERAVIRMQDAASPMPPSGGSSAADIQVLQAWINAGTPKGDCGTTNPPDPFGNPVGCESGQTWNPQGKEGPTMNPGKACIACHKASGEPDAPKFNVAGTVYPSGHETDYCYGIDGKSADYSDVIVEITDANNVVHELHPGTTGNFSLISAAFATPYKAKVKSAKGERVMGEAQTDGDCNGCHTVNGGGNGSKAPGRIVVPL